MTATDAAESPKAVLLEPASAWNIDFGEERCRMARFFEHDGERHVFLVDQYVPGSSFTMTLAGPTLRSLRRYQDLEIGIIKDKPLKTDVNFTKVDFGDFGKAILVNASIARPGEEREKATVGINLESAGKVDRVVLRGGRRIVSFETGNMQKVAEVMNSCTRGLFELWGLDPDKHLGHTAPKWLNVKEVAKRIQKTYPRKALRDGVEGILRLRVIIGEQGEVSGCKMVQVTQAKELEGHACKMMQEAKFEPAKSASGEPMTSYYMTTVTYRMNEPSRSPVYFY